MKPSVDRCLQIIDGLEARLQREHNLAVEFSNELIEIRKLLAAAKNEIARLEQTVLGRA